MHRMAFFGNLVGAPFLQDPRSTPSLPFSPFNLALFVLWRLADAMPLPSSPLPYPSIHLAICCQLSSIDCPLWTIQSPCGWDKDVSSIELVLYLLCRRYRPL